LKKANPRDKDGTDGREGDIKCIIIREREDES
jgi:hypothetical protein